MSKLDQWAHDMPRYRYGLTDIRDGLAVTITKVIDSKVDLKAPVVYTVKLKSGGSECNCIASMYGLCRHLFMANEIVKHFRCPKHALQPDVPLSDQFSLGEVETGGSISYKIKCRRCAAAFVPGGKPTHEHGMIGDWLCLSDIQTIREVLSTELSSLLPCKSKSLRSPGTRSARAGRQAHGEPACV